MRVREPFNAVSHLVGLLLAAAGTAALLRMARTGPQLLAFSVYGATLLLLYGVSTLYHTLPLSDRSLRAFKRLDHIAIYLLIAGTYTPVGLVTLHGPWGWGMLAGIWGIAAAGVPFKILYLDAPPWISTATYLGMGYFALLAIVPLVRAVGPEGLGWLIAGGIAYTVGAVIYTRERPDPFPGLFGHHEIWHVLVLIGSGCHFAFMVRHVV
jgi:hemolysin III